MLPILASIDLPSQWPTTDASFFWLGLNSAGHWVVRETTGRRAGLFRTREAALKYVRDESIGGSFTILEQPEGLELERQKQPYESSQTREKWRGHAICDPTMNSEIA
jgi:hypothetical protein